MSSCLVMQASPWAIKNKETAVVEREGFTITYFDLESPQLGTRVGFEPLKVTAAQDVLQPFLGRIPAFFDASFRQRANRETGKAELQLSGLAFVAPLLMPAAGDLA
jgi:hypothetical protein